VSGLSIGSQSFTANYSGDGNLLPSSGSGSTIVAKAPTSTSVAVSSPVTYPATVKVTATVSTTGSGVRPTGPVTFYDGNTSLGIVNLPTTGPSAVSLTLTNPTASTHTLRAVFAGDGNYTGSFGSTALVVNPETSHTALQAPPAVFGQTETLTASVTHTDGGGTVGFTADGTTVPGCAHVALAMTAGVGTATCPVTGLSVGSHAFGSAYSGDTNDTSSSATASITVGKAATSLALSGPATSRFGAAVTLTATAAAVSPGQGQPTGNVTFTDGGAVVGSAPLQVKSGADTTTVTITGLQAGGHALAAHYPGDTNFAAGDGTATDVVSFTSLITGTQAGPLTVASGQSVLVTGTVRGPITVQSGGALDVSGSVGGPITASGGATGITLCGANISGPVTVNSSPGWIAIGGNGCSATSIAGPLTLNGNTAGLLVSGASIAGPVAVANNTGHAPVQVGGTYPGPTISGNTVSGPLSCSGNSPPPTNAGVPNKVTGPRSGQCATPATF
jgi:hypothetical protein